MKLFTRYSRINVIATIIIFLIASAAFYVSLRFVIIRQIDDDLRIEEGEIKTYVHEYDHMPLSISVKDQVIEYKNFLTPFRKRYFTSVLLTDTEDKAKENFRQLVFGIQAGGQWYRVTVSKSLEQTNHLMESILGITFVTILVILVVSFFINRVVLKRIWKPFYQSLETVKNFKVGNNHPVQLQPVSIDEFTIMNQTLERLTSQAQLDYMALKTFSENASHEIQTPIAIIRSKLDILIQDEQLTESQSQAVQSSYMAIQRLAKLNQSLLLLAKIENNQFQEMLQIDLLPMLQAKLADFQELWMVHNISVIADITKSEVKMNPELADILLNNLLSNATRHNYAGGNIRVVLGKNHLVLSNTSTGPVLEQEKLFHRFYKASVSNDQHGLGLSIIKQICDVSGFTITYSHGKEMHHFHITWQ